MSRIEIAQNPWAEEWIMINQQTTSHEREINVVPLIDVLLVLVIIFMLLYSARHITPLAVSPKDAVVAQSNPSLIIDLTADGDFAINGLAVSSLQLRTRLREVFADEQDLLVVVRSAPNRKYREFMGVVDEVRSNGGTVVVGAGGSE